MLHYWKISVACSGCLAICKKWLHEHLGCVCVCGGGGGGGNQTPLPSTFDTIHPIDMEFGTYNKLHLYFQLNETTRCLIGFHGNDSQINDVASGRHLRFLIFQILSKF